MGRYVLGLDGGTGGIRAFVFDANGTPITSASQTYETSYPQPGRAEQQPEQSDTITVTDHNDNVVTLPRQIDRIVVCCNRSLGCV